MPGCALPRGATGVEARPVATCSRFQSGRAAVALLGAAGSGRREAGDPSRCRRWGRREPCSPRRVPAAGQRLPSRALRPERPEPTGPRLCLGRAQPGAQDSAGVCGPGDRLRSWCSAGRLPTVPGDGQGAGGHPSQHPGTQVPPPLIPEPGTRVGPPLYPHLGTQVRSLAIPVGISLRCVWV